MKCSSRLLAALVALCCLRTVLSIDVDIDEDCANNEKCIDRHITGIIDRFDQEERVPLIGGLEIIKTVDLEPNNLQNNEDVGVIDRIKRYVMNHQLAFRNTNERSSRSMGEEARSKRLRKLILPLLLALKLKLVIVLPIILSAIALIAIKGVFAGMFAILLSGVTALKSLTEQKQDQVTAILATPLQSLHHHDVKWGRQDAVQEMPSQQVPVEAYGLPYSGYQNLAQSSMPMRI